MSHATPLRGSWLSEQDCDLDAFRALVERATDPADHPHAAEVVDDVPFYEGERLRAAGEAERRAVAEEVVRALTDGPGSPSSAAPSRTPRSWTGPPRPSRR